MAVMMRTSQQAAVRPTSVRTPVVLRPGAMRPVRATPDDKPADVPQSTPDVAQGEYEEYKQNLSEGKIAEPPLAGSVPTTSAPSFTEVMGFSGMPEIINGRLAMLGFVAAMAAELSSGDSVLKQVSQEPTLITMTFVLFIAASLIPAFMRKRESVGPFTPSAELINGRAAMIGFAAMLYLESVYNAPMF